MPCVVCGMMTGQEPQDPLKTAQTLDVHQFEALGELQPDARRDMLRQMVGLFVVEVRDWLTAARVALASADASTLGRVAHGLKGVCGTIGAERMRALAVALEHSLAAGRLSDAGPAVDQLDDEFLRVSERLSEYEK